MLQRDLRGERKVLLPARATELFPPPPTSPHDAEHAVAGTALQATANIIWSGRSWEITSKPSCCYHLLVQDPGPVHPGPHLGDVQLLVEGPVLGTELCHTVMELLDAAKGKGTGPCVSQEAGEPRRALWSPDFTGKTQSTLLSLCGPGLLQQCPELVLLFSISRDVSGITTQEDAAGKSGLSLPSWETPPPDFYIEGLGVKGSKAPEAN